MALVDSNCNPLPMAVVVPVAQNSTSTMTPSKSKGKSNRRSPPRRSAAEENATKMKARAEQATKVLKSYGYEVHQRNGQRCTTSINPVKAPGDRERCEIFVGRLPRDMFEDELYPFFQKAGKIYNIRLMMDLSGFNRGYAFVKYMKPAEAVRACQTLNECFIRQDCPRVGIKLSFDNKRLYFGNLPVKCTKEKLLAELRKNLDDVVDVELPDCPTHENKRYAYVVFKTHEAATQARRVLVPGDVKMFNRKINVDWARPDPVPDPVPKNRPQALTALSPMDPIELALPGQADSVSNNFFINNIFNNNKVINHLHQQLTSPACIINNPFEDPDCPKVPTLDINNNDLIQFEGDNGIWEPMISMSVNNGSNFKVSDQEIYLNSLYQQLHNI